MKREYKFNNELVPSNRKPLIIAIAGIACLMIFAVGVTINETRTTPDRAVQSMRGYVVHSDMFTKEKVIVAQDRSIGLDGGLTATFQLTNEEVKTLLAADQLLICPPRRKCETEKPAYDHSGTNYGSNIWMTLPEDIEDEHVPEATYSLTVDTKSNQAQWNFGAY